MDTFSEMREALQSDLNITSTSSQFPTATLNLALNRSYIKSGALFDWTSLEDSQTTSTAANQEYYEYPDDWRPDSMWRLTVDDTLYGEDPDGSPMVFADYLIWKSDNTNSTKKKWSTQWRRYFIYPTPTTVGSDNITIWGFKNVEELTADGDTTIFSYNLPECNEAVVLEAVAILRKKGEAMESAQMYSAESKATLAIAYNKIKRNKSKYEKTQPFFNVEDFYGSTNSKKQVTGNF